MKLFQFETILKAGVTEMRGSYLGDYEVLVKTSESRPFRHVVDLVFDQKHKVVVLVVKEKKRQPRKRRSS